MLKGGGAERGEEHAKHTARGIWVHARPEKFRILGQIISGAVLRQKLIAGDQSRNLNSIALLAKPQPLVEEAWHNAVTKSITDEHPCICRIIIEKKQRTTMFVSGRGHSGPKSK